MTTIQTFSNYRVLLALGAVDEYDNEVIEYLLWEVRVGRLLRLTAWGCHCCGNAHDVPLSEGTPCSLPTAANQLWIFWDATYIDDDAAESAKEIEQALAVASDLLGAAPLA
ncbi:hypothetical protein ACIQU4_27560 [Streptomyces sp. NPDC090741]|uniref:hypothetical protein n=1 Tax=Streptomyces sp. NPDC090741 TaxID=3365967 RepID=UPI003803051D